MQNIFMWHTFACTVQGVQSQESITYPKCLHKHLLNFIYLSLTLFNPSFILFSYSLWEIHLISMWENSGLWDSSSHRITEWLRLEGTSGGHLV